MADGSAGEPIWYHDRRCESGACVEIALDGDTVLLRSSKNQRATPVALSRDEWREFLAAAKDGIYDWIS
jgi:Domain of unknown function (DUF397)